jgi:pimeloyl-ACP methyl ester carboxylesterase
MRLIFLILIILGYILFSFIDLKTNNEDLLADLRTDSTRTIIGTYLSEGIEMRYADIGNEKNPLVIFIHGAPGSLDAFNNFLKDPDLRSRTRMIAVDRAGYGLSNFGIAETSLQKQASLIAPLLQKNRGNQKPIIVGHSFGGTIAAKLAMDYPDMIGGVILAGAAVDPDHEKFFSVARIIEIPLLNKIVPQSMLVANQEKNTHVDELKLMLPDWSKINTSVTILHGKKDGLVPIENACFAEKALANAQVKMAIYDNAGHLIPWTKPDLLKKEILSLID